jgi:hypothetical protein
MKIYLAIALIFSAAGGYIGYRLKKAEVKTVTVEKVVVDTKVKTVTKERVLPSGEIQRETVSQSESHSDTVSIRPKKDWFVAVARTPDKSLTTLSVNRRILGELFISASATDKGQVMFGIGAAF